MCFPFVFKLDFILFLVHAPYLFNLSWTFFSQPLVLEVVIPLLFCISSLRALKEINFSNISHFLQVRDENFASLTIIFVSQGKVLCKGEVLVWKDIKMYHVDNKKKQTEVEVGHSKSGELWCHCWYYEHVFLY